MKEQLYTIPVTDAFSSGSECPVCALYSDLERSAVDFVLGPSYMEDDVRMKTDELGFCKAHLEMLLSEKNRLGLALILKTHLDRQYREGSTFLSAKIKPRSLLKKNEDAAFSGWASRGTENCYICGKIDDLFTRYLDTILYLYKKEPDFREKYEASKGFCQAHAGLLVEKGRETLSGEMLNSFYEKTLELYLEGIKRVSDDLDWFTLKFDYRYQDAPWKNARDSIERAAVKTNGILKKEEPKQ